MQDTEKRKQVIKYFKSILIFPSERKHLNRYHKSSNPKLYKFISGTKDIFISIADTKSINSRAEYFPHALRRGYRAFNTCSV
ncbi:Hypothetical predicted protein [Octopus vulgaris]|uniref:Uncharacterized protein n=1 Tax=Octopus vulgaris TaxID=6645 RepID=A0AA36AR24_OCTVU|nr:Hypothetical predicted protein [Octopus vulgaris]